MNKLTLKWGTLKSWDFDKKEAKALLKEYTKIGASMSCMTQRDTQRQKEIICQLIDLADGDIFLEWDGEFVSKDKAKEYVRNYGKSD